MKKPYRYRWTPYVCYWFKEHMWRNKYDRDRMWVMREYWEIGVRLKKRLYSRTVVQDDGYKVSTLTILGVQFVHLKWADSRRRLDWTIWERL